jgi:uncharacterized protein
MAGSGSGKASMKLHQARPDGRNVFTGYGPGFVAVNGVRKESSIIVLGDRLHDWEVKRFEELTQEAFADLARLPAEILLLGTGPSVRFPHPRLTQAVRDARMGLEVMDTNAACRTYNILIAEERHVAAALFINA